MPQIIKNITLDFDLNGNSPTISAMRGDNGLVVEALLTKSGELLTINNNEYVALSVQNGENTSSLLPVAYNGRKATFTLPNSLTATVGRKICQLHLLKDSGETLSSARFSLVIFESNSAVASAVASNDFTLLTNKLQEVASAVSAETSRVSAETSRVSAETSRVSAETSRATAETSRVSAETSRATAENSRATAETARSSAFQNAMSEIDDALGNLTIEDVDSDKEYSYKLKVENKNLVLELNEI